MANANYANMLLRPPTLAKVSLDIVRWASARTCGSTIDLTGWQILPGYSLPLNLLSVILVLS